MASLLASDYLLASTRVLLDDCSDHPVMHDIFAQLDAAGFDVYINPVNEGAQSFVTAISLSSDQSDFICYLDDDVAIKPDLLRTLHQSYLTIEKDQAVPRDKLLLTGFHCDPDHSVEGRHATLVDYGTYVEKFSCGGVSYFFHRELIDTVVSAWRRDLDWGVVDAMHQKSGKIFAIKPSLIEHIGEVGLHSMPENYDRAVDF